MAVVNILSAFGYKWAQDGTVQPIEDAQYRAGWSFIGAVPPSVEQFNKVHQVADEKSNWLYAQMAAVFAAAGETPSVGDLTSLRDSLASMYQNGRLSDISFVTTTQVYARPAGATGGSLVLAVGGGGSGGGAPATSAGAVGGGGGGGGGAWALSWLPAGLPNGTVLTIGSGGAAVSGSAEGGTATSVGALMTAPGSTGGTFAQGSAPIQTGGGAAPIASGGNLINATGESGHVTTVLSASLGAGAAGGGSPFGAGAPTTAFQNNGVAALSRGAGGSGATSGPSQGSRAGGAGAGGAVLIVNFS